MLQKLYIRNYVIIDELSIDFDPQLNVLTGETGAGKSIIVGALSLILGDRVDTSVLIKKDKKCIIEAVFNISGKENVLSLLEDEGLDIEKETIIRREIAANGKSRVFINDSPVNLKTLNKITDFLVDLHRQFDTYLMRHGSFVYEILDAVAGNQKISKTYQTAFKKYRTLARKYEEARSAHVEQQKEADYKQFLFEELQEADFKEQELEGIERQIEEINHFEQILQTLQDTKHILEDAEPAVGQELRRLVQKFDELREIFPQFGEMAQRMESARLELIDIAEECSHLSHDLEHNPNELQILKERIDMGYRLLKKHQVNTTDELIKIGRQLKTEISGSVAAEQQLELLENERDIAFEEMKILAKKLHENRVKQAPVFAKEINDLLHVIGLPNAQVKIEVVELSDYNEEGNSQVGFLWDANKSGQFKPIQKAASGGELSRIMLCIKTLTAEAVALPTLIFDEVDTGVSGEAARQVGILLQKLSRSHQVICITHQPQVAGRGDTHFYVYKSNEDHHIKTHIRHLGYGERIQAIAQMIGGETPSEAALMNAKELVMPIEEK